MQQAAAQPAGAGPAAGAEAVVRAELHGAGDGVGPVEASAGHARFFTGPYERRVIPLVGHNVPQEAPGEFARAILDLPAG